MTRQPTKRKKAATPKKTGRPTIRTPEIDRIIIEGISAGTPLTTLCSAPNMPNPSTVYDWLEADSNLSQRFARAREIGFDVIATDALDIIDKEPGRVISITDGERSSERMDSAAVQWAKNRAELRLKLLAKWDPKRYGDMIKHAGADGGPMAITVSSEDAGL
ncbi:hypothetical protein [Sphingomonas crocodyli]|uniref:Terminase small subunit protein n=1 Tax=Sphingomonas crocodyli TaxID=1979270 RepID=A0A437M7L8_9SPHN|nr:hypothetical protein [Sphingomonas crocodyli]RVT93710.1 hypothetical protein EOD43_07545 [Sphingomonas crocodyli]